MLDEMSRPLIRGRPEGGASRRLEASMSDPGTPLVGILGTGDFSRSLARRLVASGYQVVVGSRTPKRSVALFPEEAEVTHKHTHVHTHYVIGVFVSTPFLVMIIYLLSLSAGRDNCCCCGCLKDTLLEMRVVV